MPRTDEKAKRIAAGKIADSRHSMILAERYFRDQVIAGNKAGMSLREIAEAAGYRSTSQIQAILKTK